MPSSAPRAPAPTVGGWTATGRRFVDAASAMPAVLDVDRPRHGIAIEPAEAGRPFHLLGLDLRSDCRLADHWVRGDDVTAVYESSDARHLRTTAMWRRHASDGGIRAWELIASAQTSLLQSDSIVAAVSEVDAAEPLWGTCHDGTVRWAAAPSPEATCVLLHGGGQHRPTGTSVLVAVHPGDAGRMHVRTDGPRAVVECWLFSTALEKGVLLRSRVLAAVGPTADATAWATALATAFAASPPMLTT